MKNTLKSKSDLKINSNFIVNSKSNFKFKLLSLFVVFAIPSFLFIFSFQAHSELISEKNPEKELNKTLKDKKIDSKRFEEKSKVEKSPNSEWNSQTHEKVEALSWAGDLRKGEEVYEPCGACHLLSAQGSLDGNFPRLAAQYKTVLIKQINDIKSGLRENPQMKPFTKLIKSAKELSDVASYINSLKLPCSVGKGSGEAESLRLGATRYKKDCLSCHGANGEGNEAKYIPLIAHQHYEYNLRQLKSIQQNGRENSHPEMKKTIKKYTTEELKAVSDYISRLEVPSLSIKESCKDKEARTE